MRPASTALEKASESLTWVGKYIHIYKWISMHARCTCMNRIYIYIYIYIHTWLWPSIYPSAYILYILYIPYLATASLNVSFRLKEKQTSHTTNNQHHNTTTIPVVCICELTITSNSEKQGKYQYTRQVTHVRRHFIEKTLESLLVGLIERVEKKKEKVTKKGRNGGERKGRRVERDEGEKRTLCFEDY